MANDFLTQFAQIEDVLITYFSKLQTFFCYYCFVFRFPLSQGRHESKLWGGGLRKNTSRKEAKKDTGIPPTLPW